jgi:propionyl-CoA carboxylase beta chain
MLDLIHAIADEGRSSKAHRHFAKNIIVGFARLGGKSVGIVANQPAHLAGTLDIDASVKGARFVASATRSTFRSCLRGCPGLPARDVQEYGGSSATGAKLLYAFAEATGRRLTVITRKALRRRVLRDVEQTHPDRRQLRVADRGESR